MKSRNVNYDLAVLGSGPQGLNVASWIKKENPNYNVIVLESQKKYPHKIGESTLSGFCKAVRSNDIRHEAWQNLFYTKKGLGFWHTDEYNTDLRTLPEYIIETFDETFQIERRTFDELLEHNCKRQGVEIIRGARVQAAECELSASGNKIKYIKDGEEVFLNCKMVVDATGPASIINNHYLEDGDYIESDVPFQTSSVWAYYKNVKWLKDYENWALDAENPRDEYTQHICFKEGWVWYIPIVSWTKSKDENLSAMLKYLSDPESPLLSRDELATKFDCVYEQIWSIGISLRNDRDNVIREKGSAATFEKYLEKIPTFKQLLEGAELLNGYYPNHKPYAKRLNYRRRAKQFAGDGWLAVGDAAFFVDPLRSPGLTGGVAMGYHAKIAILKALSENNFSKQTFEGYSQRIEELHEMLEDQNQIAYMSHNHPEGIALVRRFGEVSSRGHYNEFQHQEEYQFPDTNVWGHLYTEHFRMQKQVLAIMLEEEERVGKIKNIENQSGADYEIMIARMKQVIGDHLEKNLYLNPFTVVNQDKIRENEQGVKAVA